METEHTETVVDKAVAYVKDFLGMPTANVVANPKNSDAPEPTTEDAMRLDPHAYSFNKIVERSQRSMEPETDAPEALKDRLYDEKKLPSESDTRESVERSEATDGSLNPAVVIAAIPMV